MRSFAPRVQGRRSARKIIDSVILENRLLQYVLLFLGIGGFIGSLIAGQWEIALLVFCSAVRAVQQIRRENQKIRLLEIPLNNSTTATEAAAAIHKMCTREFGDDREDECWGRNTWQMKSQLFWKRD